MKLKKDVDLVSFLEAVQHCRRDVYLDTRDGSHLDLKSVLSQFVFASTEGVHCPFSRAAIEGGLSPEVSMTLTDRYFQSVEACRSLSELTEVAATMQNDFVQRVHKVRSSTLSKPILDCCDYINMHLEEKLSLRDMAGRFKNSEPYRSRKFREETGRSFKEYVRHQRLDQAKALLLDSALDIRDISDRLHFCSPSFFAEQFKAEFGVSPSRWRDQAP